MEQQNMRFNPDEEAMRRHQAMAQEDEGRIYPSLIEEIDDRIFYTLAESIESGEHTAYEAQLIYDAWVKIFYYERK